MGCHQTKMVPVQQQNTILEQSSCDFTGTILIQCKNPAAVSYKGRNTALQMKTLQELYFACRFVVEHVPIWVKKGTVRFPSDDSVPVIMVGPGTGVAPFRSFIQHRSSSCKAGPTFPRSRNPSRQLPYSSVQKTHLLSQN